MSRTRRGRPALPSIFICSEHPHGIVSRRAGKGSEMDSDLELRTLRHFMAVAETLSFGEAADRMHISQPQLSRRIQTLERELDVTLFDRAGRRISLTGAGECLLSESRRLLGEQKKVIDTVRQASRGESGALTVRLRSLCGCLRDPKNSHALRETLSRR